MFTRGLQSRCRHGRQFVCTKIIPSTTSLSPPTRLERECGVRHSVCAMRFRALMHTEKNLRCKSPFRSFGSATQPPNRISTLLNHASRNTGNATDTDVASPVLNGARIRADAFSTCFQNFSVGSAAYVLLALRLTSCSSARWLVRRLLFLMP